MKDSVDMFVLLNMVDVVDMVKMVDMIGTLDLVRHGPHLTFQQ